MSYEYMSEEEWYTEEEGGEVAAEVVVERELGGGPRLRRWRSREAVAGAKEEWRKRWGAAWGVLAVTTGGSKVVW
jgi:hypothetical protein